MSATYLVQMRIAPAPVRFLPEAMSALVFLYVVLAGTRNRFRFVRPQYWIVFGVLAAIIGCGIVANSVGAGPIVAGLRYYLRAIPFFFLPAVFLFRESQIKQQLQLLMLLALLQVPIAVFQRLELVQQGRFTGDYVYGTLVISGTLSIFMVGAMCVLLAFALRHRIGKLPCLLLFLLFVIPTAVNETKVTVFLIPIGVLLTLLVAQPPGRRLRMLAPAVALISVAAAVFVPLYDYFGRTNRPSQGAYSVSDMLEKGYFERYLDQQAQVGTSKKEAGRIDAVTVPFSVLARNPVHFAFGFGLGNASVSSLGAQFSGEHSGLFWIYASASSAATFLLETGTLGLLCVLGLHMLILRDSLFVAQNSDTLTGALAVAWVAVVAIATLTLFYSPTYVFESLSYLFWYFSGVIAAQRMRLFVAEPAKGMATPANRPEALGATFANRV